MTEISDIVISAMAVLARRRSIFHSEADFQLELAYEIHLQHPDAQIRLEKRVANDPRVELDILVALDSRVFGIEVKYPSSKLVAEVEGELFALVTGAPDLERYDALARSGVARAGTTQQVLPLDGAFNALSSCSASAAARSWPRSSGLVAAAPRSALARDVSRR